MKDLQNKLDQQEPPDFDRLALWHKIQRPKRRRMLFIWWGLGAASFIGGTYIIQSSWPLRAASSVLTEQQGVMEQPESPQSKTSTKWDHSPFNEGPVIPSPPKTPNAQWVPSTAEPMAPIQGISQNLHPAKSNANTANKVFPTHPVADLSEQEKTPNWTLPHLAGVIDSSAANDRQSLSHLPTLDFIVHEQALAVLGFQHSKSPKIQTLSRNEFSFRIGAASHLYLWGGERCTPMKERPVLPGYFLNLQYKKIFPKGHYLLADLGYTFHQSKLNTSTTKFQQLYDEFTGKSILTTTTFYELYNQYQRLDVSLGAGHYWSWKGFELALDAGLGTAHWIKTEGDYLDEESGILPLPGGNVRQGVLFGSLNGELSRAFPNAYRMGILISGKTPIRLNPTGSDCHHSVWPIYLGMSISKRF